MNIRNPFVPLFYQASPPKASTSTKPNTGDSQKRCILCQPHDLVTEAGGAGFMWEEAPVVQPPKPALSEAEGLSAERSSACLRSEPICNSLQPPPPPPSSKVHAPPAP